MFAKLVRGFDRGSSKSNGPGNARDLLDGFEYPCALIELPESPVFVAVYGTLMAGQVNALGSETKARMVSREPCRIPGEMFVMGLTVSTLALFGSSPRTLRWSYPG